MTEQVDSILWCADCMTKHAADLLAHAQVKKNSRLAKLAKEAYQIASKMANVKSSKDYQKIRDLEHRAEDLMTGLRQERKKLQNDCPTCGELDESVRSFLGGAKHLNMGGTQKLSMKAEQKKLVGNALAGNFIGKGISVATPMAVTGETFGIQNKALANLGIGAALTAVALYGKLKGRGDDIAAIAGANLVAGELVDIAMAQMTPATIIRAPMAAPAPMGVTVGKGGAPASLYQSTMFGQPGASPQFANGGLIFVD